MKEETPINSDKPATPGNPIPSLSDTFKDLEKQNGNTPKEEYPKNKSLRNMIVLAAFASFIVLAAGVYYIWQNTDLPKILMP